MKKFFFTVLIIMLLSSISLFGQHFYCRNYSLNDGLPDNTINDIFKDSRGFLWIGTNAGLSRFDGKNFINYTSISGLANDIVVSITENNHGEIIAACKNGGISYVYADKIYNADTSKGLVSNSVTALYFSKKYKLLFIGTEDGLNVLNNNKIVSIQKAAKHNDYKLHVTKFLETNDHIYVFTSQGLSFKYNPHIENLSLTSNQVVNRPYINSVFINSVNDTIVNTNYNSIEIYHSSKLTEYENFGFINDYLNDNEGNTWIAIKQHKNKDESIFLLNNGKLKCYNSLLNIKTNNILSLELDPKEDLIWIGTENKGLYLFPLHNFKYYNSDDFGLNHMNIIDLFSDDYLWICTEKEIIQYKNDKVISIISHEHFNNSFKDFSKKQLKAKYAYLIDKNGSYQKYEKLISEGKYNFPNPYLNYKYNIPTILPSGSLYKPLKYDILTNKQFSYLTGIAGKKDNNIWIGSNAGLFKYDLNTKKLDFIDVTGHKFEKFGFDNLKNIIASNWDNLIIENNQNIESYNFYTDESPINVNKIISKNDEVWFSSPDHGIFLKKQNKFYSSYNQKSLSTIFFNDICCDSFGNIIAAGNNGQLLFLDLVNDTITSKFIISVEKEIKGTSIRWIHCTKSSLLIGTNAGINKLDLQSLYNSGIVDIEYINREQGLTNYSGNIAITDTSDYLWIGANDQLIKRKFDSDLTKEHNQINYFIRKIEVNNKVLNPEEYGNSNEWSLIPTKAFVLPYHKNTITFYFDVIHFLDPGAIKYQFNLEGYNKIWSDFSTEEKISFQNLPPRNYRLRIKVYNNSNIDANQELSISFTIEQPFWKKWYFIFATVVFIFISIWAIVQIRTNSIKNKERLRAQIAERVTEFEMKALRAQMNPHFIFNAINSIQNYMLDNDIDAALNYLSDFAKLIRLTLDNVSKKKINLEDELSYLKYYLNLEKMRFDKSFETEIILPKELSIGKIMIPPMIIQPFIENSIKYGFIHNTQSAKIKLEFIVTPDNFLKCIIEDNGIGRKKSKELSKNSKTHKSKSTYITYERFVLLNQTEAKKDYSIETIDLYDDFGFAKGTRVEINIPL